MNRIKELLVLFSLAALFAGRPSHMPRPQSPLENPKSECGKILKRRYLLSYAHGNFAKVSLCAEALPILESRLQAHARKFRPSKNEDAAKDARPGQ